MTRAPRTPPAHEVAGPRASDAARHLRERRGLVGRLASALTEARAVSAKELAESFEFFARARRFVTGPLVADLCAGHGLVGVLYALFEREVERVVLLDRRRPASHARIAAVAAEVAPWTAPKLAYVETALKRAEPHLAPGAALVAVHACGGRSDRAIDLALALGGPLALLPCCYPASRCPAPPALALHLGAPLATDVDRTYRLERAGWRVRWDELPPGITPMSRMIVARPPAQRTE